MINNLLKITVSDEDTIVVYKVQTYSNKKDNKKQNISNDKVYFVFIYQVQNKVWLVLGINYYVLVDDR